MSNQAEKKPQCGWRVKVRNVIKVVSTNRKPTRSKNEMVSLKSSKFYVCDSTPVQAVEKTVGCGSLMMLEAAEVQYGICPVKKMFMGQKLLIYTLPNRDGLQELDQKVPPESIVTKAAQETVTEPAKRVVMKRTEETFMFEPDKTADFTEKTQDGLADNKSPMTETSLDGLPEEPGRQAEVKNATSLFTQPKPVHMSPVQGMYFGSQQVNCQLNVN